MADRGDNETPNTGGLKLLIVIFKFGETGIDSADLNQLSLEKNVYNKARAKSLMSVTPQGSQLQAFCLNTLTYKMDTII